MPLTRVTSNVIQDGTIIDADISPSAAIAASKMGAGQLPAGVTTLATGSTTARSLANRFAERFNVKDWGLVGDGVTDDAPALRALMAHVNTLENAYIYFPPGRYNLNTFTDGTTNFSIPPGASQQVKNVVFFRNNFTNAIKNITFKGDNAILESALYCNTTNIYPNAGYVVFFAFEGRINILCDGIEFKRKVGEVGQQPLMAEDITGATSNNGASYAFIVTGINSFNNGDTSLNGRKPEQVIIRNCKFIDFSQAINIWSSDYVDISFCKFNSTWGICSTGGVNIDHTSSINIRFAVNFVNCTNNEFIGGPKDYTPILGIASGNNQIFRPIENAAFNIGAPRSNICNNVISRFSYEYIASGTTIFSTLAENCHVVSDNTLDGEPGIGANWKNYNRSGNDGIVINGPNATVVGNNIIAMQKAIWASTNNESGSFNLGNAGLLISSNNITLATNPIFGKNGTIGIEVSQTQSNINLTYPVRISNNIITADNIVEYTIGGNLPVWDGNPTTYVGPLFSSSCAISLAGSSLSQTIINDNTLTLKSKQNPNLYYGAIVSDCQMELINNKVHGWDFVFWKMGGNESQFTSRGLTTYNVKRLFASPQVMGGELVCCFDHKLIFTPTEVGWYRLWSNLSLNGQINLQIQTQPAGRYGDSSGSDNTKLYLQSTELILAQGGTDIVPTRAVQVIQNSHIQQEFCPINKIYVKPLNNGGNGIQIYAYVDKITEKLQLTFTGGGGSNANGYAVVTNGVITSVVMTNNGTGYTSAPTVTVRGLINTREFDFQPVYGGGAILTANRSGGSITSVTVTNGGSGFSQPIEITSILKTFCPSGQIFYINKLNTIPDNGLEFNFSTGFKAISYFANVFIPGGTLRYGTGYPLLGTTVPAITPEFIGQEFIDRTNQIVYRATGIENSSNWKALN